MYFPYQYSFYVLQELCAERDLDVIYSSAVIATQPNIKKGKHKESGQSYFFK